MKVLCSIFFEISCADISYVFQVVKSGTAQLSVGMAGIDDVEPVEASSSTPSIKVVVVGDDSVGKSCFVTHYVNEEFDPFQPVTIGSYFLTKAIEHGGITSKLQVCEVLFRLNHY